MPKPLLYLQSVTDRKGVTRNYYRHRDYRAALPSRHSPRFDLEYRRVSAADPYPRDYEPRDRDMGRPTSVYLVGCSGHIKIGVAVDPKKRLEGINNGTPIRAVLLRTATFR